MEDKQTIRMWGGKPGWTNHEDVITEMSIEKPHPLRTFSELYGYVPNYPPPSESLDTNPFNLIEGNENKLY